jgi:hypothetical protein
MQILFPSDFFKPTKPDEMFRKQATVFEKQGMEFSTVNIDELSAEPKIFPPIKNKMVLYRGWMLESKNYHFLCRTIEKNGGTSFINLDEYLSTHYLPNWYTKIKEFTPETVILDTNSDLQNELKKLNWTQFFIKDYVKSLKTSMGSIITSIEEIDSVVQEMKKFRGEIEGGICVRKVENFDPETEKRYFVVHGKPYAKNQSDKIPPLVKKCSAIISSKFFSVDVVKTKEGIERIVEIGDGQVSDLVGWSPDRLAEILVR